jgi:hypothetical protein
MESLKIRFLFLPESMTLRAYHSMPEELFNWPAKCRLKSRISIILKKLPEYRLIM